MPAMISIDLTGVTDTADFRLVIITVGHAMTVDISVTVIIFAVIVFFASVYY